MLLLYDHLLPDALVHLLELLWLPTPNHSPLSVRRSCTLIHLHSVHRHIRCLLHVLTAHAASSATDSDSCSLPALHILHHSLLLRHILWGRLSLPKAAHSPGACSPSTDHSSHALLPLLLLLRLLLVVATKLVLELLLLLLSLAIEHAALATDSYASSLHTAHRCSACLDHRIGIHHSLTARSGWDLGLGLHLLLLWLLLLDHIRMHSSARHHLILTHHLLLLRLLLLLLRTPDTHDTRSAPAPANTSDNAHSLAGSWCHDYTRYSSNAAAHYLITHIPAWPALLLHYWIASGHLPANHSGSTCPHHPTHLCLLHHGRVLASSNSLGHHSSDHAANRSTRGHLTSNRATDKLLLLLLRLLRNLLLLCLLLLHVEGHATSPNTDSPTHIRIPVDKHIVQRLLRLV